MDSLVYLHIELVALISSMLLCPAMVLKVNKISLRIKVKEKPGQQTGIERANIKAASFSGGTERQILKNVDNIVKTAFPLDKVSGYYQESKINVVDRKRSWNILSSSSKERNTFKVYWKVKSLKGIMETDKKRFPQINVKN